MRDFFSIQSNYETHHNNSYQFKVDLKLNLIDLKLKVYKQVNKVINILLVDLPGVTRTRDNKLKAETKAQKIGRRVFHIFFYLIILKSFLGISSLIYY